MTNDSQILAQNDNVTSTLYTFFGFIKGMLGVNYKIGYELDFTSNPLANLHDYSSNKVIYQGTIISESDSTGWNFSRISYWRTLCDDPSTPYLYF